MRREATRKLASGWIRKGSNALSLGPWGAAERSSAAAIETHFHSKYHLPVQGRQAWRGGKIEGDESGGEIVAETQVGSEGRRESSRQTQTKAEK